MMQSVKIGHFSFFRFGFTASFFLNELSRIRQRWGQHVFHCLQSVIFHCSLPKWHGIRLAGFSIIFHEVHAILPECWRPNLDQGGLWFNSIAHALHSECSIQIQSLTFSDKDIQVEGGVKDHNLRCRESCFPATQCWSRCLIQYFYFIMFNVGNKD